MVDYDLGRGIAHCGTSLETLASKESRVALASKYISLSSEAETRNFATSPIRGGVVIMNINFSWSL